MKWFKVFLLALLVLIVLSACSPVAQSQAVQLPAELIALLGMVLLSVFTGLFKWLGDKIGQDLSGRAAEIATAASAVLVLVINWALGLVPAAYDTWINALFAFLIILLGGNGLYSLFLRKKNR